MGWNHMGMRGLDSHGDEGLDSHGDEGDRLMG